VEKHLLPLFAVLTGSPKDGAFSAGYRFVPSSTEENQAKGTLLVNLTLTSTEKIDLNQLSMQLVNRLHESYYQEGKMPIPSSLKQAVEQVPIKLKEILPTLGMHNLDIQLTSAVIWGQFLYLGRLAGGDIFIKRGSYLGPVNFNKIASGRLQDNDWLFLANTNFWNSLQASDLKTILEENNFDEALKKIDQVVGHLQDISCVLAYFQVEEELQEQENLNLVEPPPASGQLAWKERLIPVQARLQAVLRWFLMKAKKLLTVVLPQIYRQLLSFRKKRRPAPAAEGHHLTRGKKRWRVLIPILIIVFTLGLFGNLYLKGRSENRAQASTLLQQASDKKNEAKNLQTLNAQRARELLTQAQADLEEVKKLNSKEKGIEELEKEISELLATLRREYRLAQLPLFYDLSSLKPNLQVASLAFGKDSVVAVDKQNGSLVLLNLAEKQGSVLVEDSRLKNSLKVVVEGAVAYVAVGDKISRFDLDRKEFLGEWSVGETIKDFSIYNGSLYFLTDTTLKRAQISGDSLSSPSNYVSSGSIELSGSRGVSVDGFVWVVNSGTVLKLSRGQREDFSLSGLEKGLKNPQAIYSSETSANLYILDKENGRVVVIAKNGSYYAQYITPQVEEITGLIADESKNRLYLSGKEKIYLVEIDRN
jgi:hypothetical protein